MKASALILLLAVSSSLAQGTFQNLDFESATIVPIPGDYLQRVEFTSAFPGRTIAGGLSGVLYNRIYLDSTGISIIDDPSCANFGCRILDGNYTAVLNAGIVGTITNVQDIKLSQTGMVPATAQSLRFSAFFDGIIEPPDTVLNLLLGGRQLSFTSLETGTNYNVYGADIHQLAGQTAELDFVLRSRVPHVGDRYLDDIQFSDIAVPEPGVVALLVLGGVFLIRLNLRSSYKSHGAAGKVRAGSRF